MNRKQIFIKQTLTLQEIVTGQPAFKSAAFSITKEPGYDYLVGVMLVDLTGNFTYLNGNQASIIDGIRSQDGSVLMEAALADILFSADHIPFHDKWLFVQKEVRSKKIDMTVTSTNIPHTDDITVQLITKWSKEPIKENMLNSQNTTFTIPSGITAYELPITIRPGYSKIKGVRVSSLEGSQDLDVGFTIENGPEIQEPIHRSAFFSNISVPIKDRMMPWDLPVPKNRIKVIVRESFGNATTGTHKLAVEFILEK